MKNNKFKAFAYIGLGLSSLIVVNRITAVNSLKKVNKLDEVSTISGINFDPGFNFPEVDKGSGGADLAVIPETSADISIIPEKQEIVKSEEFGGDRFLTPKVDWSKFLEWINFDYSLYAFCGLMAAFWFNFPNPGHYWRNFPNVFLHCGHCGVVRPFAIHQESCRRRKYNLREKLIDKLKPSGNSDGYPITRTIINAFWDVSAFPLEVVFSLVIGGLWTSVYIPLSLFFLFKEGGDEAGGFIKELVKYLWLILTNPWRRMGRLLTTGTTDN